MTDNSNEISLAELGRHRLQSIGKTVLILLGIAILGIVAAAVNCQFVDDASRRFFQGYLVAFAFVLSVSLGALFFVLVQHLMRAGWAVVVRRLAEVFCLNMLIVGVLFLPIAWSVWQGDGLVYEWSKNAPVQSHSSVAVEKGSVGSTGLMGSASPATRLVSHTRGAVAMKRGEHQIESHNATKPYLSNMRFLLTWALFFCIWIGLAVFYYRNSVRQDTTKEVKLTLKMEWWSGIGTILFGFSLTYAAFDLLMSLDPAWFSTIFGVYYFSGCAVAGLATLLLSVLLLKRFNLAPAVFSDELQRDLGRLLFAFVFFWAYIGFSQYMLLWYANMPETTGWMVNRGMSTATGYKNSWGWLVIVLLLAHFILPFCGFMSRHVKSNSNWMIFWCIWMLAIHYLDLYWIVIPEYQSGLTISLIEIGTAVAVVAVYLIAAVWIGSCARLFAVGDPRMPESLTRHALY